MVRSIPRSDNAEGKKERAQAVIPDSVLNRQKHTKTKKYIYEVKWMHKSMESNTWVEREVLLYLQAAGDSALVGLVIALDRIGRGRLGMSLLWYGTYSQNIRVGI